MHSVIKEDTRVKLAAVSQHPRNPNNGDVEGIAESLRTNGLYRRLVVQKSTGHILDGNHTFQAALSLGWTDVEVTYVDVDDDAAVKILIAANAYAKRAVMDDALLLELIDGLPDVMGTGLTDIDIDNLRTLMADTVWSPTEDDGATEDPSAESFWPQIKLRVPPEVFDNWRAALDSQDGKDDVAKLTNLLAAIADAELVGT